MPNTIEQVRNEYKQHGKLVALFVRAAIVKKFPALENHVVVSFAPMTDNQKYDIKSEMSTGFLTVQFGLASGHVDFMATVNNCAAQCASVWNKRRDVLINRHAKEMVGLLQNGLSGDSLMNVVNLIPMEAVEV